MVVIHFTFVSSPTPFYRFKRDDRRLIIGRCLVFDIHPSAVSLSTLCQCCNGAILIHSFVVSKREGIIVSILFNSTCADVFWSCIRVRDGYLVGSALAIPRSLFTIITSVRSAGGEREISSKGWLNRKTVWWRWGVALFLVRRLVDAWTAITNRLD